MNRKLTAVSLIASLLVLSSGTAALAADEETPDAIATLEQVALAAPGGDADVLVDVADVATVDSTGLVIDETINGVDVEISSAPANAISIGEVEISLPASNSGDVLADGVVEYTEGDDTSVVVVVKEDSSVQVTSILPSADAPTRYDYELTLPDGATPLIAMEDGSLSSTAVDGSLALGVAPAWAYDAAGTAVPTHYEVQGSTLTQVVDHVGGDFVYPIVADPYYGQALFTKVTTKQAANIVSAVTSDFARKLQKGTGPGIPAGDVIRGQDVLRSQGWAELKSKTWIITSKATWKQQYDCHVLGAFTPNTGGPSWDLEGNRSDNHNWLINVWNHKCNW